MEYDTAGNPILGPGETYTGPEMPIDFDMTDYDREWRGKIENLLERLVEQNCVILELLDKPKKVKQERPAVWFQTFWQQYPKKAGRKKCLEIWKRRNLDRIKGVLLADINRRKKECPKWLAGYAPNCSTYLNGDLWQDEIQAANTQPVNVPSEMGALVRFAKKRGIKHPEGKVGEKPDVFRARVVREVAGEGE